MTEADTVLSRGTDHETQVPRGRTVLAATHSAMFDPSAGVGPGRQVPARSSRRNTRHQSRSRTSERASARITSVVACEPELPPLEMIRGMKSASTTARVRDSKGMADLAVLLARPGRVPPASS